MERTVIFNPIADFSIVGNIWDNVNTQLDKMNNILLGLDISFNFRNRADIFNTAFQ